MAELFLWIAETRRVPRPLTRRGVIAPVVALVTLGVLLSPGQGWAIMNTWWITLCVPALVITVVVLAVTARPLLAALTGQLLVACGGPIRVSAGRRLLADPRTPGRVAGIWFGAHSGLAGGRGGPGVDRLSGGGPIAGADRATRNGRRQPAAAAVCSSPTGWLGSNRKRLIVMDPRLGRTR